MSDFCLRLHLCFVDELSNGALRLLLVVRGCEVRVEVLQRVGEQDPVHVRNGGGGALDVEQHHVVAAACGWGKGSGGGGGG